jgi:hypothetical protein
MSNLSSQLPEDIRNEFVVDNDGKVFAKSINTVARLAGVTKDTIVRGGDFHNKELAEKLTNQGFTPATSAKGEKMPDIVAALIITYYAYESKAANDTARKVALAFSSIGFRTYM